MISDSLLSRKAVVDADGRFSIDSLVFIIPEDNESYKVISKYDEEDDYENKSVMDYINIVLSNDFKYYFYDENWDIVDGVKYEK